jgi:hypothetical protein
MPEIRAHQVMIERKILELMCGKKKVMRDGDEMTSVQME